MEKFVPIEIKRLRYTTRDITFDIFLKVSENHFAHVFAKSTGLDYNRLEKYIQRGVTELHIRESELSLFEEFCGKTTEVIFSDEGLPKEKRMAALLNMTEQNLAELFAQFDVDTDTAEHSKTLIKGYVELMSEDPQTLAVILKLASYGNYLYYHAIAVSVFSLLLARSLGYFDSKTLELVGLGGFLSDIGRTQLPAELNDSQRELTEEEWRVMRSHPKLGLKMLEKTDGVPDEVRYIVYQHHEQPGGSGYPNSIRGSVIYPLARIVSICDAFSALISKRPFRKAYTVAEAIKVMRTEHGKFDSDLLDALAKVFLQTRPGTGSQSQAA